MKRFIVLLFLFSYCLFTGCKKEKTPEEYVLSVMIDGEEYKATHPLGRSWGTILNRIYDYYFGFNINIYSSSKDCFLLRIHINSKEDFKLNTKYNLSRMCEGWYNGIQKGEQKFILNSGWIEFTSIKKEGRIFVYGKFSMNLKNKDTDIPIVLTDGIFGPLKLYGSYVPIELSE